MWDNLNARWVNERHYSQETLKHVQQVHQVSILVTNNVTTFPITILDVKLQKPFPSKVKNQPLHYKLELD